MLQYPSLSGFTFDNPKFNGGKTVKKILAALLACMALVLCACGSGGDTTDADSDTGANVTAKPTKKPTKGPTAPITQAPDDDPTGGDLTPEALGLKTTFEVQTNYPTMPLNNAPNDMWIYITQDNQLCVRSNKTGQVLVVAEDAKALYKINNGGGELYYLTTNDDLVYIMLRCLEANNYREEADYEIVNTATLLPNVADVVISSSYSSGDVTLILCKDGSVYRMGGEADATPDVEIEEVPGAANGKKHRLFKFATDGAVLLASGWDINMPTVISKDGEWYTVAYDAFDKKYIKNSFYSDMKVIAWEDGGAGAFVLDGSGNFSGSRSSREHISRWVLLYDDNVAQYGYTNAFRLTGYSYWDGTKLIPQDETQSFIRNYFSWKAICLPGEYAYQSAQILCIIDEESNLLYRGETIAADAATYGLFDGRLWYVSNTGEFYLSKEGATQTSIVFEKRRENIAYAKVVGSVIYFMQTDGTYVDNAGTVFAEKVKLAG